MKKAILLIVIILGINSIYAQTAKEHYTIAETTLKEANYITAIQHAEKAKALLQKTNPKIESLLAFAYFNNGDIVKAKVSYNTLIKLTPYSKQQSDEFKQFIDLGNSIDEALEQKEKEFEFEQANMGKTRMKKAMLIENEYAKQEQVKNRETQLRSPEEKFRQIALAEDNTDTKLKYLKEISKEFPNSNNSAQLKADIKQAEIDKKYEVAANKVMPEIMNDFSKFNSLVEGKPYLINNRTSFTTSKNEKAVIIFYDTRYIIYTIPNPADVRKLFKDEVVSYGNGLNFMANAEIRKKIKGPNGNRREVAFSVAVSEMADNSKVVYLGGFGDELLKKIEAPYYEQLDEVIYYYSLKGDIRADLVFPGNKWEKDFYNPIIETGKIIKTVDYKLIEDGDLVKRLNKLGFKNKTLTDFNYPKGLYISFKQTNNPKMIFPEKKVHYVLKKRFKIGLEQLKGKTYFDYYRPTTRKTYYGYIEYSGSFSEAELLTSITGLDNNYIMSEKSFNTIYSSFNKNVGINKTKYFTNTKTKYFFEIIPQLVKGNKVNLFTNIKTGFIYNGEVSTYHDNGKLESIGKMLKGKKNGYWEYYYENGILKKGCNYYMDEYNDTLRTYDNTGHITGMEYYAKGGIRVSSYIYGHNDNGYRFEYTCNEDGIKHGKSSVYDPDGVLFFSEIYDEGLLLDDVIFYYEDGNIKSKGKWINRSLNGHTVFYYKSGKKKAEGEYVNDIKQGIWKTYDENGEFIKSENYINGIEQ